MFLSIHDNCVVQSSRSSIIMWVICGLQLHYFSWHMNRWKVPSELSGCHLSSA